MYGIVSVAAYAAPLRASMVPLSLNRTITARVVSSVTTPDESPKIPSIEVDPGVASNCAVNESACDGRAALVHAAPLKRQPAAPARAPFAGGAVGVSHAIRPMPTSAAPYRGANERKSRPVSVIGHALRVPAGKRDAAS